MTLNKYSVLTVKFYLVDLMQSFDDLISLNWEVGKGRSIRLSESNYDAIYPDLNTKCLSSYINGRDTATFSIINETVRHPSYETVTET